MAPRNPASAYRSQAVQTANGPQLLLMLCDRLAVDIARAEVALEANGTTRRRTSTCSTRRRSFACCGTRSIPSGFKGGRELLSVYVFLESHLVKANLAKDVSLVRECAELLRPIHEAWTRAVGANEREDAVPPSWDEYLAEAAAHLANVRRAGRAGVTPPAPPDRPMGPMPAECVAPARRLAVGYDQLALEVTTADVDRRPPAHLSCRAPSTCGRRRRPLHRHPGLSGSASAENLARPPQLSSGAVRRDTRARIAQQEPGRLTPPHPCEECSRGRRRRVHRHLAVRSRRRRRSAAGRSPTTSRTRTRPTSRPTR